MTLAPHVHPDSPHFPGDNSPQPAFGAADALRSLGIWAIGAPHLLGWAAFVALAAKLGATRRIDPALKLMSRTVPALCGVRIRVENQARIPANAPVVYVANHVNIFDMFALYRTIPGYARSLELAEHFSWPIFGAFITAAGQIPIDPSDARLTAKGLKRAADMLRQGDSVVVLPEGARTLDGSVGPCFPGAFRLAIGAEVPVVPLGIFGGRAISRRGDWRIRPGTMTVRVGEPVPTSKLTLRDAGALAQTCRQRIIALLQGETSQSSGEDARHPL